MPALDVSLISFYFNPRPREEGDDTVLAHSPQEAVISIHALVKRATNHLNLSPMGRRFQSTPS